MKSATKRNKKGVIILVAVLIMMLSIALPLLLIPNNSAPNLIDVPDPNDSAINNKLHLTDNTGQILTDNTGHAADMYLYSGETTQFFLHNAEGGSYTIKIVPNTNATETFDFYTSSGQLKSFWMQGEMTAGFDIVKGKTNFTIKTPVAGMTGILDKVYNTTTALAGTVPAGDLFAAILSFENGTTLVMDFHLGIRSNSVTLSETEVAF